MTDFMKKSLIIFISILLLILVIGSVQAEDINETDVLTDVDSVDVSCDADPSEVISADDGSPDETTVKTFSNLYSDIYDAGNNSVLILKILNNL